MIVFLTLELVAFPLLPLGPLLVAGVAMATSLRQSRSRVIALWILAGLLAAVVMAPFVISLFHLELVEEGPVHNA
ncbi:MAG: hypothetical protein JWP32_1665 [Schumannella sp.]|nr:hypothetical protein [Schumannella sp.]